MILKKISPPDRFGGALLLHSRIESVVVLWHPSEGSICKYAIACVLVHNLDPMMASLPLKPSLAHMVSSPVKDFWSTMYTQSLKWSKKAPCNLADQHRSVDGSLNSVSLGCLELNMGETSSWQVPLCCKQTHNSCYNPIILCNLKDNWDGIKDHTILGC